MCRKRIPTLAAAIALWTASWPAQGADNAPVVGTWQIKSFSIVTLDTNETSRPFGDDLVGYIQYSPGGHMLVFLAKAKIKSPAGPAYTDAERTEIHRNMFGAYAGTYRVEGNKVIHQVVASWRPDWIGTDQIRYFEIDGKKLTIKTAPVKFSQTGKDIVSTLVFERVE